MNIDEEVEKAVHFFWRTREEQGLKQKESGKLDSGARALVTGGRQMEYFQLIVKKIAEEVGFPASTVHSTWNLELPGFFRPEKKWDIVIIDNGNLVAALEFKSQIGPSFGNNFNNRTEEAIGTAQDIWTAYREGAFIKQPAPWLGYLFLLEKCPKSESAIKLKEPNFKVFPEFIGSSYAKRYEILLTKLLLERLYSGASLILTPRDSSEVKVYTPNSQLSYKLFFEQLRGHLQTYQASKAM